MPGSWVQVQDQGQQTDAAAHRRSSSSAHINIYRDLQKLFMGVRTNKAITLAAAAMPLDINQEKCCGQKRP